MTDPKDTKEHPEVLKLFQPNPKDAPKKVDEEEGEKKEGEEGEQ